jgi:hypothetical protein
VTLFVAWVVFPAVLAVLSLGCGLLVEAAAGVGLPGVVRLPAGFALVLAVAQLATMSARTAQLVTPAVVVLAACGLLLSFPWRGRSLDGWAAGAAGGVFLVFAAPIVLSGAATVAGWIKLDDTATWLALTDRVMQHGRSVAGLAHSTYEVTVAANLGVGYPVGAFVPLGVGGQLVGQDIAWLVQPYEAFLAALLALAIYALAARVVTSRALRALAAFAGAQAAIFYGYAMWGGLKEVAAAVLIALVAALVPSLLDRGDALRAVIPLAAATAATFDVLTVGGAIWLAPILLPALWFVFRDRGKRFTLIATGSFVVVTAVLAIPTIAITATFTKGASFVTQSSDLGNLIRPLKFVQVFGIWPVGDFRVDPHDLGPTYILIAIAAVAGAVGVLYAVRRRAPELVLYVASALFGAVVLTQIGSPWIGAKALATAGPALVAVAAAGGAALLEGGRRLEGFFALLAVTGGVVWSNALQYHDVDLAPHEALAELSTIGDRFAGQGPALMTEYSPYGARHFLRKLDAESAGELRWRLIPLLSGQGVGKGGYADIDRFQTSAVLVYRTLVLNRSPFASRPPSVYRLVWSGRDYEVWQRPTVLTRIVEHLPLGSGSQAASVPSCASVLRLAREAKAAGGMLAAVERSPATVSPLSRASVSPGWKTYTAQPQLVFPNGPGTLKTTVDLPSTGRYGVWVGGSFRRRLEVAVDGYRVGAARHQLTHPGVYTPFGAIQLTAGTHDVVLRYTADNLRPGSGGMYSYLGPLVLSRSTAVLPVSTVTPAAARSLCGKSLDWIEALGR